MARKIQLTHGQLDAIRTSGDIDLSDEDQTENCEVIEQVDSHALAGLSNLGQIELMQKAVEAAYSVNSLRAFASGWRIWCKFCRTRNIHSLPANSRDLIAFLSQRSEQEAVISARMKAAALASASNLAASIKSDSKAAKALANRSRPTVKPLAVNPESSDGEKPRISAASIRRDLAAIAFVHRIGGYPNPLLAPEVDLKIRSVMKTRAKKREVLSVPGLCFQELSEILDGLEESLERDNGQNRFHRLRLLRDGALLTVAFHAMLRRSELVALQLRHFHFLGEKGAIVRVTSSKTDSMSDGKNLRIPQEAGSWVLRWIAEAGLDMADGHEPVFRALPYRNQFKDEMPPLDASEVSRIFKARTGNELIGGHSARIGAAETLAADGASLLELMVHGRWKTARMPSHYVRNMSGEDNPMMRFNARLPPRKPRKPSG